MNVTKIKFNKEEKEIPKDYKRWVYDIEVYRNYFSIVLKNYDTKYYKRFVIFNDRNDFVEFIEFLRSEVKILIGFNNHNFDDVILNYMDRNYNRLAYETSFFITNELKKVSDNIIEDDNSLYYTYKRNFRIKTSIDLFLYWSKMLRLSKQLSLKSIAVNMNWHKIQDLPIEPWEMIKEEDVDLLLSYNDNDVNITEELAIRLKDDINLRFSAKKRYGFNCLSWDGVKLGLNILLKRYSDRMNIPINSIIDLRTHREEIVLKDIILPFVSFKENKENDSYHYRYIEKDKLIHQFKSFKGAYEYLKTLTVTSTGEISLEVIHEGTRYDIKSGGLHSYHNFEIISKNSDDEVMCDDDVSSMYPTLGGRHNIGPAHLGKEFTEGLWESVQERIELKHKGLGKSPEAELIKLSLNGG